MRSRRAPFARALVAGLCVVAAGCSTPAVAHDTYQTGRQRVVEYVNQAGAALPAHSGFHAVTLHDTDREVCRKKFLGYSLGGQVAREPEVTQIVSLPAGVAPNAMLARVEATWRTHGYRVDTSGLSDPRFPKVRAYVGDYRLEATNLSFTAGFNSSGPRVSLYAVGQCMRG
jgi:hypothetical protein